MRRLLPKPEMFPDVAGWAKNLVATLQTVLDTNDGLAQYTNVPHMLPGGLLTEMETGGAAIKYRAADTQRLMFCLNETAKGLVLCYSDGTHWRRVMDQVIIS